VVELLKLAFVGLEHLRSREGVLPGRHIDQELSSYPRRDDDQRGYFALRSERHRTHANGGFYGSTTVLTVMTAVLFAIQSYAVCVAPK
jgi:hypothetical protein